MAYTGIFCTEAEMQFKAGENRDATGDTETNHNQIAAEVESHINVLCRYNFSDNYASLNTDIRAILKEAASNLGAVYLIQYNMSGYTSRVEAEDMINILMKRFYDCIEILKDQKSVTYITSGTTPAVGGDSITTDETTITKSAGGVISVKDSGITNAKINSAAAIAYSKLNLALGIVNADISGSAAIDFSKLTGIHGVVPKLKVGTFTRDMTAASGNVGYTGVGFQPRILIFSGCVNLSRISNIFGYDDGTSKMHLADNGSTTPNVYQSDTSYSIILKESDTQTQIAVVASRDSDGFTLTWSKNGTPSAGTATMGYIAIG